MSSLHEVIYQIVSEPQLLVKLVSNPHEFVEQYELSPGEVQALVATSSGNNFQLLLAPQTFKNTMKNLLEGLWVPPTFP
jgi:hypothetical protein